MISFSLLSAVSSQVFKGYFISQREELLEKQAARISQLMSSAFGINSGIFGAMTLQNRMSEQVKNIQDYMDTSILFIDNEFRVFLTSPDISECNGATITNKGIEPVMLGNVVSIQGKLIDSFPSKMLSVAYPIVIDQQIIGAVILNASIPELERTIREVVRLTVVGFFIMGAVSFVLIYLSSKNITKPLLEMNEAAKIIASGDFEKRIEVSTRDEVGQLGESFNEMAKSLDEQEKLRREFLTNISHDIRSPLTSMRGFVQALIDGMVPEEKQERYLKIILEETERLTKLSNDILDLNQVQTTEVSLYRTNFDVNELILHTLQMVETRMRDGEINLKINTAPTMVNADYEKIQRVIYNLIDNSIKFTPAGGIISLETKMENKKVFVSIKDTGIGIEEEAVKRIFDRFYKVDSSRGLYKNGTGLGLSIVQAFVNAHGETIEVQSKIDEGTEFTFSLPLI